MPCLYSSFGVEAVVELGSEIIWANYGQPQGIAPTNRYGRGVGVILYGCPYSN